MAGRFDEPIRPIGEVAESLDLPQHVLRFWETRFREIDPLKRAGGRRLYRQRDVDIVVAIRHLLYSEGYTIKGVQRILKERGVDTVVAEVIRRLSGEPTAVDSQQMAEDFAASEGDVDETDAEADAFDEAAHTAFVAAREEVPAEPPPAVVVATVPALPETPPPQPRPLNDDDARILRAALAEIEECRRLLKLTQR